MLQSANDVADFPAKALGILLSSCHVSLVLLFFGLLGVDCFFFLSLFFFSGFTVAFQHLPLMLAASTNIYSCHQKENGN